MKRFFNAIFRPVCVFNKWIQVEALHSPVKVNLIIFHRKLSVLPHVRVADIETFFELIFEFVSK